MSTACLQETRHYGISTRCIPKVYPFDIFRDNIYSDQEFFSKIPIRGLVYFSSSLFSFFPFYFWLFCPWDSQWNLYCILQARFQFKLMYSVRKVSLSTNIYLLFLLFLVYPEGNVFCEKVSVSFFTDDIYFPHIRLL